MSINNATYTENYSDSNDSVDKCTNLTETSRNRQDMFVENVAPHSTENSVDGNYDETWNMTDENPIVSSDLSSSDEEENIARDLVSWINKHQIKQNAADDLLKTLKAHGNNTLPLSSRTLLKTDRYVPT